jgi:hypothetical protein
MRRLATLISFGFIVTHISAQQLSNGGFETWTNGNPASWSTSHFCIAASTLESQETSIVYQGSSAIKLVSGTVPSPANISYAGFAHYGASIYDNSLQDFTMYGVALPYRPDSIQFAYRYSPSGSDSANVFLNLYKGNIGNIIGIVNNNLGASSSYRLVTLPISYMSAQIPDSIGLTFYSGGLFPPVTGSTLYVDAVKLIYINAPNGIEPTEETVETRVYPNPTNSKLYISTGEKMIGNSVKVYNVLGSEMLEHELLNTHDAIDVSKLQSGIYLYRIVDKNNKIILTGKFNKE